MSTPVGEWIRRNSSQDAWRTPATQPLIGATVIFPQINSQRARSLAAGDRSYAHVGGAAAFLRRSGTVFQIAASDHSVNTLFSFDYDFFAANGKGPYSTLVADTHGNLYGTVSEGGTHADGTVFEIASGSHEVTTVASLDGTNGRFPFDGAIADADGNLYGTTQYGGAFDSGAIFKVVAGTHTLTTLASFNGTNGRYPYARLFADANDNLYGTTGYGGTYDDGTVFELEASTSALHTLATFDGANGLKPTSDLIADANGNLYGTTIIGGDYGDGTLFEIAA